MGSHKTKQQIEDEYRKLQKLYADKCAECDLAKTVSSAAKADSEETLRLLGEARAELQLKEACNKKLADQFYDYRNELDKVRPHLADAIEKRDSLKVELEGVRGALKRESELRVDTEKKRDEYKQEMVKWKNEAGDYHNRWDGARMENELLRNELNEVEKIQRKHNMLTLESIDNALRHWRYTDDKLSHDLSMPLESLIQLLDEYGVNDFCKLRERLMYGPTANYSNALANVRRLEKENLDLKALSDDLEKQRRDLEQQLRRQTDNCKYWTDRAFRDEEELRKSMEHDRIAQENFEKASRRNDELQNEVNKLYQRWTDEFNPEDELLGRKVLEWQQINAILVKHNIESADSLETELEHLKTLRLSPFRSLGKEWRDVVDKHNIESAAKLDARLSCSVPEEYMKVFNMYGIDSAEALRKRLNSLNRIKELFNTIRGSVPGFSNVVDFVKELA